MDLLCCALRVVPGNQSGRERPGTEVAGMVLAGNTLGEYCGYVPPDLAEKIFDSGLLDESDGEAERRTRSEQGAPRWHLLAPQRQARY